MPLPVDAETVRFDVAGGVGDVKTVGVVGVSADHQVAELVVEGEVGDVDVASGLKDASRLPVQSPVVSQQNADPVEVRHQLFRPAGAVSLSSSSIITHHHPPSPIITHHHLSSYTIPHPRHQ